MINVSYIKTTLICIILLPIIYLVYVGYQVYGYKLDTSLETKPISLTAKLSILQNSPVRQLVDPKVTTYLQQHKVYVALTTIPSRINNIEHTLSTLDQSHITNILLAIPEKFGRTNEPYNIPANLLQKFPELKIIRIEHDLGPITKLIPAVEYARSIDPESIIITIDDDVAYPFGMVNEMIYYSVLSNAVVGGIVNNNISKDYFWSQQHAGNKLINFVHSQVWWQQIGLRKREFVVGFGAIAYRAKFLDPELLRTLSSLDSSCFQADDLVISYALNMQGIARAKIANKYLNTNLILPFEYGSNKDALHKLSDVMTRYQKCNKFLEDFR